MPRKVLGNDPFKKGAATREAVLQRPLPPSKKASPRRPPTPELQHPDPHGHPGSPSLPVDPQPHAAAPIGTELDHAPHGHAGSPSARVDPRPHAASPAAHELTAPHGHPSSPTIQPDVVAHRGSPDGVVSPTPHPASPAAVELVPPSAHASAPSVGADPSPHDAAPAPPFEAVEHAEVPSPPQPQPHSEPHPRPGLLRGLARAARAALGLERTAQVDTWGKDAQLTSALRPIAQALYDKYWRVKVTGAANVPPGACILVANHAGALPLDGPVVHLALRRERPELTEARWLLEDQVFYAPFVGTLANRLGAVRASPENAHRLLSEGRPLIVFPEGFHGISKPFGERYQLKRFGRGGYLKVALRARVPIVPVAIVGGEESMPLLGRLPGGPFGLEYLPLTLPPLPARWHLSFGAPVDLTGAPSEPEADLAWVERKNLEVRDRIQSMLQELLASRGGVF